MFDRSLKYFSNINKDFVSKPLIKNLIKLSTARNPMIMKKINPIDAYSSIELDTLNPLDYFENNLDYLRFTMIVRLWKPSQKKGLINPESHSIADVQ